MNVGDITTSNYLSKKEIGEGAGLLLTIKSVEQENIARDDQPENLKYIMYFNEQEKGLTLNKTNGKLLASITGSEESDNWIGKRVVVYFDPSIMFKGEMKGGLRIRKPVTPKPPVPRQTAGKPVPGNKVAPVVAQPPVDDSPVGEPPAATTAVDDMPF